MPCPATIIDASSRSLPPPQSYHGGFKGSRFFFFVFFVFFVFFFFFFSRLQGNKYQPWSCKGLQGNMRPSSSSFIREPQAEADGGRKVWRNIHASSQLMVKGGVAWIPAPSYGPKWLSLGG
jgi:hypothetical protein